MKGESQNCSCPNHETHLNYWKILQLSHAWTKSKEDPNHGLDMEKIKS